MRKRGEFLYTQTEPLYRTPNSMRCATHEIWYMRATCRDKMSCSENVHSRCNGALKVVR